MGKNAPPQPDYSGAAREQASANRQLTAEQTYANRPDISTPWGGVRWTPPQFDPYYGTGGAPGGSQQAGSAGGFEPFSFGERAGSRRDTLSRIGNDTGGFNPGGGSSGQPPGAPGRWGMEVFLSPDQQQALDAQQRIQSGRSGLAEGAIGRAGQELGSAPDWGSLPGMPNANNARESAIDSVYGQMRSRLDPQFNQQSEALESKLMNQGLRPGTQAWDRAMGDFSRQRNDAYTSALSSAVQYGEQAATGEFNRGLTGRQQGISELLQRRGQSLNEANALLAGQQVAMPGMPAVPQAGVSQGPNLLGAAQAQYGAAMNSYNAQQQQLQGLMSGGMGLASIPFGF